MAKNNRLLEIADELGEESAKDMIARRIDAGKTPFQIAVELGVYPNTVFNHLKKNGYRHVDGEWVREEPIPA